MVDQSGDSWRNLLTRRKIVSYVRSPLGFYTLALLIVESFLLGSGRLFELSESVRISAMYVGVGLFILVIGIVTTLVIKYPQALVFSEQSHLEWESMQVQGDKSKPLHGRLIEVASGSEQPQKPVGQIESTKTGE